MSDLAVQAEAPALWAGVEAFGAGPDTSLLDPEFPEKRFGDYFHE